MNNPNKVAGISVREGLVFFTIHDGNEYSNPRSRAVILAIKAMGDRAYVYKSLEDAKAVEPVAGMVPLYDTDCVGELFFEREKDDITNPEWANELSTGSCVAVCQQCTSRQHIIENAAKSLKRRFDPYDDGEHRRSHRDDKDRYQHSIPALVRAQRITRPRAYLIPAREKRKVGQF